MNAANVKLPGFTLIELLSSMVIGSMILLAAAVVLGSSGESYERVSGGVSAEREGRAVIQVLTSDLSSAVFHKDGVLEESSGAWPADRIGFLSLQPEQAQTEERRIGDLCAVSYYIKELSIGGKTERCLMRGFRESKETFEALGGGQVATLFTGRPDVDEPVAFGVVSFEARPKSRDTAGRWVDWVANDVRAPEALEVRLVIARRSLAGRLKSAADWNGPLLGNAGDADRNEELEIYSTLIRYGNHEQP